ETQTGRRQASTYVVDERSDVHHDGTVTGGIGDGGVELADGVLPDLCADGTGERGLDLLLDEGSQCLVRGLEDTAQLGQYLLRQSQGRQGHEAVADLTVDVRAVECHLGGTYGERTPDARVGGDRRGGPQIGIRRQLPIAPPRRHRDGGGETPE